METIVKVTAIVVTYNRSELLVSCIKKLLTQSYELDQIVIVDNKSTDNTYENLLAQGYLDHAKIHFEFLPENLGGAGGFNHGIAVAMQLGAEWMWIMDDDAAPDPNALSNLMNHDHNMMDLYGSLAIDGDVPSWPTIVCNGEKTTVIKDISDAPSLSEAQFLPFLGLLMHRKLVELIGLPDQGYFIAADDVEYCLRAKTAGSKIYLSGKSLIHHPKAQMYDMNIFGQRLGCLRLSPWKRYYDTRNRILLARKYYGTRWLYQTIPGSFVRLVGALINEPNRLAQLWAFTAGFTDGLLNLKGKRHNLWKIRI